MTAEVCGKTIGYRTPAGTFGEVPCDLAPLHDGEHDSSQLLLRPEHALKLPEWFFEFPI